MSIVEENVGKNCSFCGEIISSESRRCSYCGSILKETQANTDYSDSDYREIDPREVYHSENVYKEESSLSNGIKVLLVVLYTLIPGIGQIAGIIHGIAMYNSKGKDKKSFGKALVIAMILVFMIYCVIIYIAAVALITLYYYIA